MSTGHAHHWYEIARTLEAPWRVLFACSVHGCIETKVETA